MRKKFKRFVATALAAGTLLTGATVVAKKHNDKQPPKEDTRIEYSMPKSGNSLRYEIQYGDTLSGIVSRYYGEENLYQNVKEIARINGIADANKIRAGSKITLPSILMGTTERNENVVRKYTVKSGDNLTKICQKVYQSYYLTDEQAYLVALKLAEYNNIDPNNILPGKRLEIPDYEELMNEEMGMKK